MRKVWVGRGVVTTVGEGAGTVVTTSSMVMSAKPLAAGAGGEGQGASVVRWQEPAENRPGLVLAVTEKVTRLRQTRLPVPPTDRRRPGGTTALWWSVLGHHHIGALGERRARRFTAVTVMVKSWVGEVLTSGKVPGPESWSSMVMVATPLASGVGV